MALGLAALLDDVAVIAKMASVASTKAVGVVVDDAAVTPQYVQGFSPARELPIIGKIAKGSLLNKAILIVLLLLLDHFLPVVLTPLLMLGGAYLVFEGAEKFWEAVRHQPADDAEDPVAAEGPVLTEDQTVRGAITTDFILSAEIMVLTVNTVNDAGGANFSLIDKALTLVLVGLLITVLVYGVVGLIVKLDDIGLHMSRRDNAGSQKMGALLVKAMPVILNVLTVVGVAAMLWVGGHILVSGCDKLGWHAPMTLIHHLAEPAHHVAAVGGALAWLVDTLCSAIVGLVVGSVIAGVLHVLPVGKHH